MIEPPPRRSVWDSPQPPRRERYVPPSPQDSAGGPAPPPRRPGQPPRPPDGKRPSSPSQGNRRGLLIGSVVVLLLIVGIAGLRSLESNPAGQLDGLTNDVQDVADVDVGGDEGPTSSDEEQPEPAPLAPPESDAPVRPLESFADVAPVARQRFLNALLPQAPTTNVEVRLEPGAPEIAQQSLDEQVAYALPYLNRYFENADELVIVGLMSASGGEQIVRDEFKDAPLFAESVSEYIYEAGYGQSSGECSGLGGFAQTDFEHSIVVIDVAASCNWFPSDYIDDSESIVGHEVMHIAQYELTGMCAGVPAWFVEGQADFVAWNLSVADGRQLYADNRAFDITTDILNLHRSLEGLSDLTNYTADGLEYSLGALAVELLVAEHGWEATTVVLSELNRKTVGCGSPDPTFSKFADSFVRTFGYTIDDFSDQVWAYAAWESGDSSATFSPLSE